MYCDSEDIQQGQQNSISTDCFIYNNYVPLNTHVDHTPIIWINLNFHFISLANSNTPTNFTVDGSDNLNGYTAYDFAQYVINELNEKMEENVMLTGDYATNILPEPTQIRFKLYSPTNSIQESVFCHPVNDINLYHYSDLVQHQSFLKQLFSTYNAEVIDVFFVRDPSAPNGWGGVGPPNTNAISITNAYQKYLSNNPDVISQILMHELGHVLSLQHSWFVTNNCGPFAANALWQSSNSNNVMAYNHQANWENCQIGISRMYLINNLKSYINREELCTYDPSDTITIASGENILWNSTRYLQGDVIIKPGGTLTITCKVGMTEGARFIVEPNAKLIIDGGHLTSVCDDKSWYGIEVLGKSNRTQYTLSNGYRHQGYLEIKNGSVIEHAQNAVALWDSYNQNLYKTGGIVIAKDSEFKNNRRSVEFMKYQNVDLNGNPKPNLSSFTNCTFTISNELRTDNTFYAHVTMWHVDGIKFSACKFKNERTDYTQQQQLGYGIYSIDAAYSVSGICDALLQAYQPCPENDIIYSEFENLYKGINASNAATANFFTVNLCKFNKNFRGIQASAINRFVAINSKYTIGNNPINGNSNPGNEHQLGIYAIKCSGYTIENNVFEQPTGTTYGLSDGVIIYQSGSAPNQVYRNTFTRLNNLGILGVGNNYNLDFPLTSGLEFLCNTFTNQVRQNLGCSHINPIDLSSTVPGSGIKGNQGTTDQSAGNCFNAPSNNPVGHFFRSNSTNGFSYYYDNAVPCRIPVNISTGINSIPITSIPNSCPIKKPQFYTPLLSSTELTQTQNVLDAEYNDYVSLKQSLLLLIDGGQTPRLRNEVFNAVPATAWQLYNELNQYSPNLSTTVALNAISREDVLPNSMIFDLLYNNPDLLQDEHIFRALDERVVPMPEYMTDILRDRADVRTTRTLLAEQMGVHYSNASELLNTIVQHYLSDSTITTNSDSMITDYIMNSNSTLHYSEALRYNLQRGHITTASEILNGLFEQEEVNETESQQTGLTAYYTNMIQWQQDSIAIASLDTTQIALLSAIAERHNDYGGIEAMNILNFFYGYNYYFDVPEIEETEGERRSEKLRASNINTALRAVPNPAGDFCTIQWLPFNAGYGPSYLRVYDVKGTVVLHTTVNSKTGNYILDTSALTSGLYLVQFQNSDKLLQLKLNVQH